MRTALVILFVVVAGGCQSFIPPPPIVVEVPVARSCLPEKMPVRPELHTEAELSALDEYKFTLAIFLDRRNLFTYAGELEVVVGGCK